MTIDGLTVLAVLVFLVPFIIFAAMGLASRRARRDRGASAAPPTIESSAQPPSR